ncbi:MAG: molybdopterin molybdotransferase MoeA [Maritimibacter sp.]
MAQLKDDCVAFGGRLLPLDDAEQRIAERFACVAEESSVDLTQAVGRILARDFAAVQALPPYDNSAVDGYALRHADLAVEGETRLPLAGIEAAGRATGTPLAPGKAVRIFTGALIPDGADTVVMQEDCQIEDDRVVIPQGVWLGANLRIKGEDIAEGSIALPAGRRLMPPDLALLGAQGQVAVGVRTPLRVALFSTGDEVTPPGQPLKPGKLYDANQYMLTGLLSRFGCSLTDGGILPDDPTHIASTLRAAAKSHDLVITSGGVSMGDEDHVRSAIEASGSLEFWRVAMRPGRPVALGEIGGTPLLGLPGNPVAALVTFVTIGRRVVEALSGAAPVLLRRYQAEADFELKKKPGRREFLRATLRETDGKLYVSQHPKLGAGMISSLTEGEVLLDLPEDMTRVSPGDMLSVLPLATLYG